MTLNQNSNYPEPVPPASQLAALPFLAAVRGFLLGSDPRMRVTLHRTINREDKEYLQQVCDYVGPDDIKERYGAGRMYAVNYGIMGASFGTRAIWRTRHFSTKGELLAGIREDMARNQETGNADEGRLSWLSVPFLGSNDRPVLILLADTFEFNYFANDERISALTKMCYGFARLIDVLEDEPFPNLRNFPLSGGESVKGPETVYTTVQEEINKFRPPKFERLTSFNYEASAG